MLMQQSQFKTNAANQQKQIITVPTVCSATGLKLPMTMSQQTIGRKIIFYLSLQKWDLVA
jgi:hypothetical protein